MGAHLAHIFETDGGIPSWWIALAAAVLAGLVLQHHVVAGFNSDQLRRRFKLMVVVVAVTALATVVAPMPGQAQPAGALLPDLISDPPRPSFFNELNTDDGGTRLVVTFDGYVHNIGEGPLDVVGNPQLDQGMKQRVRNGDEWEDVGAPTVRYETEDGHNHFHLIEAIEYVLWNELQVSQTAIGSKIGFCLVDSEQMEAVTEASYSEELDDFCQEDNPQATSLRMGISPGWRDIYDDTTTLQWVDVSDVAPGRYWIGAITDPNNEILESNETNNDLIFSTSTISVPGFSPRADAAVSVAGDVIEITLGAMSHGTVGRPVFVVEQGPEFGTLDVPVGVGLDSPELRYTGDADFSGTDQLTFSVRDAGSPYPFTTVTQTISFDVDAATGERPTPGAAPLLTAPSTFFETSLGATSSVQVTAIESTGEPARFFARGLPAGLVADSATGEISGIATAQGFFDVELIAVAADGASATQSVTWIVNPPEDTSGLDQIADRSSPRGELARLRVGTPVLGRTFEADDLPPGLSIDATSPIISGTPTEAGEYSVQVRQLDGDEVVAETTFTWTIRATTAIDFAL